MKDEVLYLFDPLCGWCFGFSPTIVDFRNQHPELDFRAVPGGMITGARVAPYHTMNDYIQNAKERLESHTGTKFGKDYLNKITPSDILMDSVPPSKALVTLESFGVDTIDAAHILQQAHFVKGKDYNDLNTYVELATTFHIEKGAFVSKYDSVEMDLAVKEAFNWVQRAGVNGFPTVILKRKDQYFLIARGFMPLDGLSQNLEAAMNEEIAN
ncbi:MAG: DsbA family protein [Marinoscillum sp.]